MSSLRYPKACLLESITDAYRDRDNNKSKFNWASKVLGLFFKPIGKEKISKNFTFDTVISQKSDILMWTYAQIISVLKHQSFRMQLLSFLKVTFKCKNTQRVFTHC